MININVHNAILIVDDEDSVRLSLERVLKKEGYQTFLAVNGIEAEKILHREHIALVLTDLRMPGIDGMDVLRHIRELTPDIPVIMITGYATLDSAVDAMKAGAYHYIAKPFRLDEAREIVRSGLELSRIKQENNQLKTRIEVLQEGIHRVGGI